MVARIKPEDEHNKNDELCNFCEKLCNFGLSDDDESLASIMTDRYVDGDGNERIEMLWEELVPEEGDEIDWEDPNDPYALKAEAKLREALKRQREEEAGEQAKATHPERSLGFTRTELNEYVTHRSQGLAKKSLDWINRASEALWDCTQGEISVESMTALRDFALKNYSSIDSHRKVIGFAAAFLKRLAKTRMDPSYQSYDAYLELPKATRVRKAITERIVTREDIESIFERIDVSAKKGKVDAKKTRNYRAYALLAAYTGLRPSTMQRLLVGQLKTAVKEKKPTLHVFAEQEKNRVEHYVPLHSLVVGAINEVLAHDFEEKDDTKPFFMFNQFEKWLERQKIPLPHVSDPKKAHLWLSDFRKFAEQFGDIIGWDITNRKYVLAHGMTGVDWEHYKHPLPENVYDVYMKSWGDVELSQ
ncbi:MAG: tyrosine-type recombinase/integrase [Halobacteriota archaeon]